MQNHLPHPPHSRQPSQPSQPSQPPEPPHPPAQQPLVLPSAVRRVPVCKASRCFCGALLLASSAGAAVHGAEDALPDSAPHPSVLSAANPAYAEGRELYQVGYMLLEAETCLPLTREEELQSDSGPATPRASALRRFAWRQLQHYRAFDATPPHSLCFYPAP
jgi:hypothetical protein